MPILPIDAGRYGSNEIKKIFDEQKRLDYQLEFEASVAESQSEIGIIPTDAAKEIAQKARSGKITVQRVRELEAVSEHDTAAMVEAISELCSDDAKPWVHYGLTSYDVIDTTISMQMRDSLSIIERKLAKIASMLAGKAVRYTVIQDYGLKFTVWASDVEQHINRIREMERRMLVCKTLGVVGTGSLMGNRALEVQSLVAKKLGLYPIDTATQVVSRERHAEFIFCLSLIASTLDKIAVEIDPLYQMMIQVAGSSDPELIRRGTVPLETKGKSLNSNVTSLAEIIKGMLNVSLDNVVLWHEMDLSASANERFTIPMAVILLDEVLNIMIDKLSGPKTIFKSNMRSSS